MEDDSIAGLGVTIWFGCTEYTSRSTLQTFEFFLFFRGVGRGGAGPVANAVLRAECMKNLRDGRRNFGGRSRDIDLKACNQALEGSGVQSEEDRGSDIW